MLAHRHVSKTPCQTSDGAPCTLLAGGRLELDHQFSGYPPAVLNLDSLRLSPLADLSAVQRARRFPAPVASSSPRGIADSAAGPHVGRQGVPQLLGMLGVHPSWLTAAGS
jgi:hypothetical protein